MLTAPTAGAATGTAAVTAAILDFLAAGRWEDLPEEVRHGARRHLLDTIGVTIAGSASVLSEQAEATLAALRAPGDVPVPGRERRADLLDAAFLSGTAAHGIELDDGYRQGSVHPGVCVVPAALYAARLRRASGRALLASVACGYEVMLALALVSHPALRKRGFHPTGVVGALGAAAAAGHLMRLDRRQLSSALGLAASAAAGLFAFLNGGTDVKRLHAGHAAREGLQSCLLALNGVAGPPDVIEGKAGFLQAFPGDREAALGFALPPGAEYRITDCYIKPYACCRHLQTALEVLIGILDDEGISEDAVKEVRVETYAISAEHAHTGWDEFASAQLSFPYILALGMRFRRVEVAHFDEDVRTDAGIAALCGKIRIGVAPDLDRLYPEFRPARVTVVTADGEFSRQGMEALGSRQFPVDDDRLGRKFVGLTAPVLGESRAAALLDRLWNVEDVPDIAAVVDTLAR